jgi:hypothetical protein
MFPLIVGGSSINICAAPAPGSAMLLSPPAVCIPAAALAVAVAVAVAVDRNISILLRTASRNCSFLK